MKGIVMDNSFFSNLKNDHLIEWIGILCNTQKRYDKFISDFLDNDNIFLSLCHYKNYLREYEGRGIGIKIETMKDITKRHDWQKLRIIIQEIFLEPIDNEASDYLISMLMCNKIEIEDLMEIHKDDSDRCFWQVLKKLMAKNRAVSVA